jgi:hypothetical protein
MRLAAAAVLSAGVLVFASPAFASHGPDVNGAAKFGLCHAYFKGSTTGTAHKHKHSKAFKTLEAAALAHSETVAAFCAGAKPGSSTAAANRHGPPTTSTKPSDANIDGTPPTTSTKPSDANLDSTPPTSSRNQSSVHDPATPPTSVGGTGIANGKSHDGAGLNGTTGAGSASDGHSAKGSNNAGTHRP